MSVGVDYAKVLTGGGLGFHIRIPLPVSRNIEKLVNGNISLKVVVNVDQNGNTTMFGFLSEDQRSLFLKLTSISGVGPSAAMATMGLYSKDEFLEILRDSDVAKILAIRGIGKKTASTFIVELQDWANSQSSFGQPSLLSNANKSKATDAISALESLGISKKEASSLVLNMGISADANETVSDIVTRALRSRNN